MNYSLKIAIWRKQLDCVKILFRWFAEFSTAIFLGLRYSITNIKRTCNDIVLLEFLSSILRWFLTNKIFFSRNTSIQTLWIQVILHRIEVILWCSSFVIGVVRLISHISVHGVNLILNNLINSFKLRLFRLTTVNQLRWCCCCCVVLFTANWFWTHFEYFLLALITSSYE